MKDYNCKKLFASSDKIK